MNALTCAIIGCTLLIYHAMTGELLPFYLSAIPIAASIALMLPS